MRRFSFGTFLVDGANQAAFQACSEIADFSRPAAAPVLIVGAKGFGKTHLLYSIVNRVRTVSHQIGIAFISADAFPTEVRQLIQDPSPVERAERAILIVDSLERFQKGLDDLEALVRLFVSRGHQVVFASTRPLEELAQLPQGLLTLMHDRETITIPEHQETGTSDESAREAIVTRQRQEIRRLHELLAQQDHTPNPPLNDTDEPTASEELEPLKQELEELRAENTLLSVSAREVRPLRRRIQELQDKLDDSGADAEGDLRKQLEEAQEENYLAQHQSTAVLSQAALLLQEVEKSRGHFAELRAEQSTRLKDLGALKETLASASGTPSQLPAPQENSELRALREELESVKSAALDLQQDRDRTQVKNQILQGTIARATTERDSVKEELHKTLQESDRRQKELDLLSNQVAHLSEEWREQETLFQAETNDLRQKLDLTSGMNNVLAVEMRSLQAQFIAGVEALDLLAEHLELGHSITVDQPAHDLETSGAIQNSEEPPHEAATSFFVTPKEDPAPASQFEAEKTPEPEGTQEPAEAAPDDLDPLTPLDAFDFGPDRNTSIPQHKPTLHHVEELRQSMELLSNYENDQTE